MPGGQTEFSQRGEVNEQFAGLLLSDLAFVTRVKRSMDVGHDLVCVLKEPDERDPSYIRAGPSFTVQVKSNRRSLQLKNEDEVRWLKNQDTPFFVCVVNRQRFSIDLYSTWNIHNSYLWCEPTRLVLKLDEMIDPEKPTYPRSKPGCREKQTVPLGRPILRIGRTDIWDGQKMEAYREILKTWILLEQENIVNIRAKMHWVVGCTEYEPGRPVPQERNLFVYYNLAANERFYLRNLGRTTSLLRIAFHHAYQGKERDAVTDARIVEVLDQLLAMYRDYFDPEIRTLLERLHEKTES